MVRTALNAGASAWHRRSRETALTSHDIAAAGSGGAGLDTATVSLTLGQLFDPAALQRILAQHGIRALVKSGTDCSSSAAAPSPIRLGVLPGPGPAGTRRRVRPGLGNGQGIWESVNLPVKPSQLAPMADPVSMVIDPAAMPSGTELFIGFFDSGHTLVVDLIYTGSHTCRNTQQPPAARSRADRPRSARHA